MSLSDSSNSPGLTLERLPLEIIEQVVDRLPQKIATLELLSLTSKVFLEPCQRRLIARIGVFGGFRRDPERLPGKALLSLLTTSPHLSSYIRYLTIYITVNDYSSGPSKDFWIWYDTYLPAALDLLPAVAHLKISKTSTRVVISDDIPAPLKASLARIVENARSVELVGIPTTFLPLVLGPSISHLSWKIRYRREEVQGEPSTTPLKDARLRSLAIIDGEQDVALPMDPSPSDLSFVHTLNLTKLRKLCFGAAGSVPEQGDLLKILGQCRGTVEELRVTPGMPTTTLGSSSEVSTMHTIFRKLSYATRQSGFSSRPTCQP